MRGPFGILVVGVGAIWLVTSGRAQAILDALTSAPQWSGGGPGGPGQAPNNGGSAGAIGYQGNYAGPGAPYPPPPPVNPGPVQ